MNVRLIGGLVVLLIGAIRFARLESMPRWVINEMPRIATRIKEVNQRRKNEGFYIGGRCGFGFDVVD